MQTIGKINGTVDANGLLISGALFAEKLPLSSYVDTFGDPDRTIEAGPPAPVGHRNNQVHIYDSIGIYLTEHHASRLIESVNFIFDESESPFQIERSFTGKFEMFGCEIASDMTEDEVSIGKRDLPGEYSVKSESCWVGVSAVRKKRRDGKRTGSRFVVRVSVCF